MTTERQRLQDKINRKKEGAEMVLARIERGGLSVSAEKSIKRRYHRTMEKIAEMEKEL